MLAATLLAFCAAEKVRLFASRCGNGGNHAWSRFVATYYLKQPEIHRRTPTSSKNCFSKFRNNLDPCCCDDCGGFVEITV